MKNTTKKTSSVYTVFKAIKGVKGQIILQNTFTDEAAAQEYAWSCVNILNMCWAGVWHNGKRIGVYVAA